MNVVFRDLNCSEVDADLLVIGVSGAPADSLGPLDRALGGGLLQLLSDKGFESKAGESVLFPTFGRVAARKLALVGLGSGDGHDLGKAAGKAGQIAREEKATHLAVDFGDLSAHRAAAIAEYVSVGNYVWDTYLREDARKPPLETLTLLGSEETPELRAAGRDARVRARWQSYTRDLVNAPAADLYPETLAERARELAQIEGVEVEVWDFERCRAEGLVGIVAVGQGSSRPGCLIHIKYRPANAVDHIALVGKGVTFDAGGLSLKPSAGMQTMRCDMGGAATVLGATGAIAGLGLPIALDTFVPAAENMCAANSFKLGDILRYNNGVTVEIHNTDAEGRLVLADALILASQVPGVSRVVDLATLTGAIIVSLGTDFTGLFTHDDGLANELLEASDAVGEYMWRMPMHKAYNRLLKGTWSQLKNVGGREAGSITAGLFLGHFVTEDVRWAHIDIAGTAFSDHAADPYAAGGTGQVVRALTSWADGLTRD